MFLNKVSNLLFTRNFKTTKTRKLSQKKFFFSNLIKIFYLFNKIIQTNAISSITNNNNNHNHHNNNHHFSYLTNYLFINQSILNRAYENILMDNSNNNNNNVAGVSSLISSVNNNNNNMSSLSKYWFANSSIIGRSFYGFVDDPANLRRQNTDFDAFLRNSSYYRDVLFMDDETKSVGSSNTLHLIGKTFVCFIFLVICFACIFGNILVILSVFTYRPLQSVQNIFIVSLAVADTLVALFVMPFHISYHITGGRWIFGTYTCHFFLTLDILLCSASTLHLCCIALDRYWAIKDSIKYAQKRTLSRVLLMILIAWISSAVISLPVIIWNTKTVRVETINDKPTDAINSISTTAKLRLLNHQTSTSNNNNNHHNNSSTSSTNKLFIDTVNESITNRNLIAVDEINKNANILTLNDDALLLDSDEKKLNENIVCDIPHDKLYRIYSSSGTFYVPLIIMTFVYIRIYLETKRRLHERAKAAQKLAKSMAFSTGLRDDSANLEKKDFCNNCSKKLFSYLCCCCGCCCINGSIASFRFKSNVKIKKIHKIDDTNFKSSATLSKTSATQVLISKNKSSRDHTPHEKVERKFRNQKCSSSYRRTSNHEESNSLNRSNLDSEYGDELSYYQTDKDLSLEANSSSPSSSRLACSKLAQQISKLHIENEKLPAFRLTKPSFGGSQTTPFCVSESKFSTDNETFNDDTFLKEQDLIAKLDSCKESEILIDQEFSVAEKEDSTNEINNNPPPATASPTTTPTAIAVTVASAAKEEKTPINAQKKPSKVSYVKNKSQVVIVDNLKNQQPTTLMLTTTTATTATTTTMPTTPTNNIQIPTSLLKQPTKSPSFNLSSQLSDSSLPKKVSIGTNTITNPNERPMMSKFNDSERKPQVNPSWTRDNVNTGVTLKQRQKISLTRERKAARTLGIIMGAFTICWCPFFVVYMLQSFEYFTDYNRLFEFLTWLGYVNSALNPIIYTIFNMDYRKSFERILFHCILCKRRN